MTTAASPAQPPLGSEAVPVVTVAARDGARLAFARQGGTLCQWWGRDGAERLYLSPANPWVATDAIRGGVPVIFPQFAARGPLPKHGFARTAVWAVVGQGVDETDGCGWVTMALDDTPETRAVWPHPFRLELTARFDDDQLSIRLDVVNSGSAAFAFTTALHSYLRAEVSDRVTGLGGLEVIDSADGDRRLRADDAPIPLDAPIDRIFLNARAPVTLARGDAGLRAGLRASLLIEQSGFCDAVVWKPAATDRLPALPPDGHSRFVCVEAAVIGAPVALDPGQRWSGTQTLRALP
ncbi:D-hexose-6-phosphate mutarotase [Azospirillum griseum]|uniref:Putative glucose-6-phosphate 1-epimerase n=1 Tax=Azospirillum griseum TaxID=2496639 RepID=A0A431VJD8_9PROT|nr:D-hexose-6-phosphate mutarotase [Azospirillum griseum]RTR22076.1 D-hexose-6-phosphate mutarotase [Azospirillum griseum]